MPTEDQAKGPSDGPAGTAPSNGSEPSIEGLPPPKPPEVINREAAGNATVRAIRLDAPLDVDGDLDEPL